MPVLTILRRFVESPIALRAIMIMNLAAPDSQGSSASGSSPVLRMPDATKNQRMNQGNIWASVTSGRSFFFLAPDLKKNQEQANGDNQCGPG